MKGEKRKIGLISSIYLIIALLFTIGTYQLSIVKAQQPCDNATKFLEDKGLMDSSSYNIPIVEGKGRVVNESFAIVKIRYPEYVVYWVSCDSGEIFDHQPSISEVLRVEIPRKIDDNLFIRMKTGPQDEQIQIGIFVYENVTQAQVDEMNLTVSEFRISKPSIIAASGLATPEQIKRLAENEGVKYIIWDKTLFPLPHSIETETPDRPISIPELRLIPYVLLIAGLFIMISIFYVKKIRRTRK